MYIIRVPVHSVFPGEVEQTINRPDVFAPPTRSSIHFGVRQLNTFPEHARRRDKPLLSFDPTVGVWRGAPDSSNFGVFLRSNFRFDLETRASLRPLGRMVGNGHYSRLPRHGSEPERKFRARKT